MTAPVLTSAELATIIEQDPANLPENLRQIIAARIRADVPLNAALAVEGYLQLGCGRHEDPDARGAYGLAGEDLNVDPSTVRRHHKKLKHHF